MGESTLHLCKVSNNPEDEYIQQLLMLFSDILRKLSKKYKLCGYELYNKYSTTNVFLTIPCKQNDDKLINEIVEFITNYKIRDYSI